jgi:hypothetical protein
MEVMVSQVAEKISYDSEVIVATKATTMLQEACENP